MPVIILIPQDNAGMPSANIYRADAVDGTYSLISNVAVLQREYEDKDGDYTKHYKVAFTDGDTESELVAVKSHIQKIIDIIRTEIKVSETDLSGADIEFLAKSCRLTIMNEICKYEYGYQPTKLENELYYKLANRYFFDANFGGAISPIEVEAYKFTRPIFLYSKPTPVKVVEFDPKMQYIKLEAPLSADEQLKCNFFYASRAIDPEIQQKLLAYKICAVYYEQKYAACIDTASTTVKIGDVTVSSGVKAANITLDISRKMDHKYEDLKRQLMAGFYRVK